ncbi:MAG TPA: hypothetical protein PLG50_10980 [bacterium]|nr:hypothetical protein [bacterium]HQG46169.1 hypothetical protein [bacterium]HQI48251.1 hypothetical protein [bacterium]HQJ65983.1 hypothetical protein [bacterium]
MKVSAQGTATCELLALAQFYQENELTKIKPFISSGIGRPITSFRPFMDNRYLVAGLGAGYSPAMQGFIM